MIYFFLCRVLRSLLQASHRSLSGMWQQPVSRFGLGSIGDAIKEMSCQETYLTQISESLERELT